MTQEEFKAEFERLTGNSPLSWQVRLWANHFVKNDLPKIIDLPTGLGKTMVMAIWLIARMQPGSKLPRRLIYVVDRRTVVDQATDLAVVLQKGDGKKLKGVGENTVAISTLRGQLADNREWSRDPSKRAIIIGTVDLIGSALLFSGYRSRYKERPLHAGLLGQDSLLVLDEAHLSKPFEKLITSISQYQSHQGTPMNVIRMSATSGEPPARVPPFTLDTDPGSQTYDLKPDPDPETGKHRNQIITRFGAKKTLTTITTDNVIESIATAADNLAKVHPGSRVVIFVKSPKDVDAVRKALIKKDKAFETKIAMLTGTMRGLERDELVDTKKPLADKEHERRVMRRFLNPENDPSQGECFLVSTSAGEVGFDLNGDHLVGDSAPLDSLIQRLGRVNRRGHGDATVILVKEKETDAKTGFDRACVATSILLADGMNVSPKALAALRESLTPEQVKEACSPQPTMVDLTDILLDAWSMTSIKEPMPGRPEVAPWLRGIDDELPQTTIAWRAELDIQGFDQLGLEDIEEWFDTHRVLAHETLGAPTSAAAKWFTDRWNQFDDKQRSEIGPRSIVVDRAGLKIVTVYEVINQLGRKNTDSIRNADLILPSSFGGIERGKGLLDADAPHIPNDESKQPFEDRAKAFAAREVAPDVADERGRYREVVTTTDEGKQPPEKIGNGTKSSNSGRLVIELESDEDKRIQLISYISKQEKPEWGSAKQTLSHHVGLVRKYIDEILSKIEGVPELARQAARLSADFHDHGKNRERWQRTVGGTETPAGKPWSDSTLGKSGGEMKRDPRGYRHEFGSLREFIDAHYGKVDQAVFDLAMHLIATHHGRGRPHFPKGGFDPETESRSPEIHTEAVRRFARLQRKYGHWRLAWLENLLRCADALASAEKDSADGERKS